MKKENRQEAKTYAREALLKSKRFSHIQKDFLGAVLQEDFYTVQEAETAVERFFGGGK